MTTLIDRLKRALEFSEAIHKAQTDEYGWNHSTVFGALSERNRTKELDAALVKAVETLQFYAQGENIYQTGCLITEGKMGGPFGAMAREALEEIEKCLEGVDT